MNDELLVKYMLGECLPDERQAVERWLEEDASHRIVYDEMLKVWEQSKVLQSMPPRDTEVSWEKLQARFHRKPAARMRPWTMYWVVAASVLLLLGLGWWMQQDQHTQKPEVAIHQVPKDTVKPEVTELLTAAAKDQRGVQDTLQDRSVVTLNKQAELRYPKQFAAQERRVQLKGEAFFSITPNKEKPFYVDAGNAVEIRVVGTSFNVKAMETYTEVIVETGIVEVKKFNRVVLLHPGEQARIRREDSTIVVQKHADKLHRYYRSRQFECENTPLWRLVEILNEAYGDRVRIENKQIRSLTLTTRFDEQPLEQILEIISETFDLRVEQRGGMYYLN